jgi:hypothetical protein
MFASVATLRAGSPSTSEADAVATTSPFRDS